MDENTFAKRAIAHKQWRWMPGMLPLVLDEDGDWVPLERVWRAQGGHLVVDRGAIPDFTDPATLGCLLALVREVYNDSTASVYYCDNWWWVSLKGHPVEHFPEGATEAEALVAALEVVGVRSGAGIEVSARTIRAVRTSDHGTQRRVIMIDLGGLSAQNLERLSKRALQLARDLRKQEPSNALALANGVKDNSYNTVRWGAVTSYTGQALVTMEDGSTWRCIGHRPKGSAEYVSRDGWIEKVPMTGGLRQAAPPQVDG